MRKLLLLFIMIVALPACLAGKRSPEASLGQAGPDLLAREDLLGEPDFFFPQLSPDGKRLAWLAKDDAGHLQVWTRGRSEPTRRARQLTHLDASIAYDRRDTIPFWFAPLSWAYDNRTLLFAPATPVRRDLWSVDAITGTTRNLTADAGKTTGKKEARVTLAGLGQGKPNAALVMIGPLDNGDLYEIHLDSGAITMREKNPGDVPIYGFVADDNLEVRAITAFYSEEGGSLVRYRDAKDKPARELVRYPRFEGTIALGYTRDANGKERVIVRSAADGDKLVIAEIDPATNKRRVLGADPDADIRLVLTHPTTHRVQAVAAVAPYTRWHVIDAAIAADVDALGRLGDHGVFRVLSRDLKDEHWVVEFDSDRGVEYGVYERASHKVVERFVQRPALTDKLATVTPVDIPGPAGTILHGYLTRSPQLDPEHPGPFVLFPHILDYFAPITQDVWGYDDQAQWLASRGYHVLQVNFSGSDGYGSAWRARGKRQAFDDLVAALDWAIAQGIADKDRVGMFGLGGSGDFFSVALPALHPGRVKCSAALGGNLLHWAEHMPVDPLGMGARLRLPILIGRSAATVAETPKWEAFVAKVHQDGGALQEVRYADTANFRRFEPEHYLDFHGRAEALFGHCLGGSVEPLPEGQPPAGVTVIR
jgi:dipeptidyl aminopeptidase/acylaminoacyl peptidase